MSDVPSAAARHCAGCGRPAAECAGGCTTDLDPPRFCACCGRRLAVQVYPGHVVVRCPANPDHVSPA